MEMGSWLLSYIAVYDSTVTPIKLLRLEFEVEASMEMPLVWISAHILIYMWGVQVQWEDSQLVPDKSCLRKQDTLL